MKTKLLKLILPIFVLVLAIMVSFAFSSNENSSEEVIPIAWYTEYTGHCFQLPFPPEDCGVDYVGPICTTQILQPVPPYLVTKDLYRYIGCSVLLFRPF
ncbi:DUF6520 family protein [Flavivirga eckloniae]|uniref:Uncharacterized protein n=1 Tax=Flavivirga eckloniae TaxID=1803846 RepID=A0A2K9PMB9_9FLAO|nr:DUF6520 family protein [Flavivirga eckloniae]AUP77717.1 hypothetical protein C1H87_02905 [Flavivirga eckloniae]